MLDLRRSRGFLAATSAVLRHCAGQRLTSWQVGSWWKIIISAQRPRMIQLRSRARYMPHHQDLLVRGDCAWEGQTNSSVSMLIRFASANEDLFQIWRHSAGQGTVWGATNLKRHSPYGGSPLVQLIYSTACMNWPKPRSVFPSMTCLPRFWFPGASRYWSCYEKNINHTSTHCFGRTLIFYDIGRWMTSSSYLGRSLGC